MQSEHGVHWATSRCSGKVRRERGGGGTRTTPFPDPPSAVKHTHLAPKNCPANPPPCATPYLRKQVCVVRGELKAWGGLPSGRCRQHLHVTGRQHLNQPELALRQEQADAHVGGPRCQDVSTVEVPRGLRGHEPRMGLQRMHAGSGFLHNKFGALR
jgi:hypothetical protein